MRSGDAIEIWQWIIEIILFVEQIDKEYSLGGSYAECYDWVAYFTRDKSVCDLMTGVKLDKIDNCKKYFDSWVSYSISDCIAFSSSSQKIANECVIRVAILNGNILMCDSIAEENLKSSCVFHITENLK